MGDWHVRHLRARLQNEESSTTYFGTLHVHNNHFLLGVVDAAKQEAYELDPFAGETSPLRSHVQHLFTVPETYTVPTLVCLPFFFPFI